MAGLFVVLGVIAVISIVWVVRMKRVILKIWSMTPLERYCKLNILLRRYGIYYEREQDIFLKRSDRVQKYKKIRGKKDNITVTFGYGQKTYLLCINRKQKGIFSQIKIQFFLESTHGRYNPITDRCCLDMALMVYEKSKRDIITRQKGWQLFVQKPCCLYEAEQMKLRMRIIFPNSNMALAFAKGMREAGWRFVVLSKDCTGVMLDVWSVPDMLKERKTLLPKMGEQISKMLIYCYCSITKPFYKTVDRMLFFHEMLPFFFPALFWGERMIRVSER